MNDRRPKTRTRGLTLLSMLVLTLPMGPAFAHTQVGIVRGGDSSACRKAERIASEKAAVHCYNTNGGRVSDKLVSACTDVNHFVIFGEGAYVGKEVRIHYICRF